MTYELITPDGKNLYFNLKVKIQTKDTLRNRKIAYEIIDKLDELVYKGKRR